MTPGKDSNYVKEYVKKYVMTSKHRHDVKKYAVDIKYMFWRQNT